MRKVTMKAKYGGECESCGLEFKSNEMIVYYLTNKAVRHEVCDRFATLPPKSKARSKASSDYEKNKRSVLSGETYRGSKNNFGKRYVGGNRPPKGV